MKKWKLYYLALIVIFVCGCQKDNSSMPATEMDIEKEKTAILDVIETQLKAFSKSDFTGISQSWLHDERALVYDNYGQVFRGWDAVSERYQGLIKQFEEFPQEDMKFNKINMQFLIYPNVAWVIWVQVRTYQWNDEPRMSKTIETRILEKRDGVWKIVGLTYTNR